MRTFKAIFVLLVLPGLTLAVIWLAGIGYVRVTDYRAAWTELKEAASSQDRELDQIRAQAEAMSDRAVGLCVRGHAQDTYTKNINYLLKHAEKLKGATGKRPWLLDAFVEFPRLQPGDLAEYEVSRWRYTCGTELEKVRSQDATPAS